MAETQERQQFNMDGKNFYVDTLSDEAKTILQNINVVETEMSKINLTLSIVKVAREKFVTDLRSHASEFEAADAVETEVVETPAGPTV